MNYNQKNEEILLDIISKRYKKDIKIILKEHSETIFHMVRCSVIAKDFGKFLGLNKEEQSLLEFAALVHDIGKMNLDANLLYKKEPITDSEFEIIKTHVIYNYKLEDKYKENIINDCIQYHHLRRDNSGYSGGNKKYNQIHYFAKIITLIDCYDVMTNLRSYKSNISSNEEVLEEIQGNFKNQFEPKVAKKFIKFLKVFYKI